MTGLRDVLEPPVSSGSLPGAVALVARGDRVEVAAVGTAVAGGNTPMARDSIFRVASLTKPVTAAAVMLLIEDGRLGLAAPVREWLPELSAPVVVRTPSSPVDDVVRPPGRSRSRTCSPSGPGTGSRRTSRCPPSRRSSANCGRGRRSLNWSPSRTPG